MCIAQRRLCRQVLTAAHNGQPQRRSLSVSCKRGEIDHKRWSQLAPTGKRCISILSRLPLQVQ